MRYGFCAMLMLVALRLALGWHFYVEGRKKYDDPNFTSAGFLRQAKGPLAPMYRDMLPEDDRRWMERFDATIPTGEEWSRRVAEHSGDVADAIAAWRKEAVKAWVDSIAERFGRLRTEIQNHFDYTDDQKAEAGVVFDRSMGFLRSDIDQSDAPIDYFMAKGREAAYKEKGAATREVPFEADRWKTIQSQLQSAANEMFGIVRTRESQLRTNLLALRDDEQKTMRFAAGRSTLETVDFYLGYCLMAIGLCLIAGLFTRLAAFGGGVFLLSVVAAQPFWIPDAVGMWKESIEMVALFTLSATPVGRWAGLDFLIHGLCMRCCQAKGSSDASNS